MYRALEPLLIRAAVRTVDELPADWPDLFGDTAALRDWLAQVWTGEGAGDAVSVASPALAEQVERVLAGSDAGRARRAVESVARYLLRMSGRATPFGVFAGVAPATTGPAPSVRWGAGHRAHARADGAWLDTVITDLEACPALLDRVPVVLNDLVQVRGDQVVLAFQPDPAQPNRGAIGRDTPPSLRDVSLRRTPVVDAVLRSTRSPILVTDLLDALTDEFPTTATTLRVAAAVGRLVRLGLLLTPLRPPMTICDGAGYLLDQLECVNADALPEAAEHVRRLRAVDRDRRQPCLRYPTDRSARSGVRTGGPALAVDLRLDAEVVLPTSLARHAAEAAAVLTRLSPDPDGTPGWNAYHAAFLERYGVGAVVPLPEVIDARIGLGFPATFRSADRTIAAAAISPRDRALLRLAQTATTTATGEEGGELVLDDALLRQLTDEHRDVSETAVGLRVPPHIEIALQIHAEDVAALSADRYRLLVRGGSRAAATTTGRFLGMLDEPDLARFRAAYATVGTVRPGAVAVQLSQPPLAPTSTHLAGTPPLLPRVLSVGEFTDQTSVLRWADLAVSGDVDGLFLIHLPDGRVVEPTVCNAVEFRTFSHPLARYLCELPRTRTSVYMPFSWGAAASLAMLPRVRFGRTVLAPARWNLTATDLPDSGTSWRTWQDGLAAWRDRFRIPDRVALVEADTLLPLDLTVDLHRRLLRTHLHRAGHARLEERPPPAAFGWLDGHAHEITIALTATGSTSAGSPCRPRVSAVGPVQVGTHGSTEAVHLPGAGTWVSAKLYTALDAVTQLLDHVPDLVEGWDKATGWWYLPYRDPEPHLRLRVQLSRPAAWGEAITRVGAWADRLQRLGFHHGLVLDTYRPETGRYGHGEAMTAAERVFVADSAAAVAELTAADTGLPIEAIAAASATDIITTVLTAGSGDTASTMQWAMRWAIEHLPHEPGPLPRPLYNLAARLADPTDTWAALRSTEVNRAGRPPASRPQIEELMTAWHRRGAALAEYRDVLRAQRDPMSVLPSLLHLHAVRLFGVDPDRERCARRLIRAAALRWTALHTPNAHPAMSDTWSGRPIVTARPRRSSS